jgi:hypothetical protein
MNNIEKQFKKVKEREIISNFTLPEEFSDALEHSFNDTKTEREPAVHLEVYLGAHMSPDDLNMMRPLFEKCDVYVPEMLGYPVGLQEEYQRVADGTAGIDEVTTRLMGSLFFRFHIAELDMIHKSEKTILFADLPSDHSLIKEMKRTFSLLGKTPPINHSFEEALADIESLYRDLGRQQQEREHYILENFKSNLSVAIQHRPDLGNREDIAVLMRMGMAHTTLAQGFVDDGFDVERIFQELPVVFASEHQLLRSILFGKKMDTELLAHALLTTLINRTIPKLFAPELLNDGIGLFRYLQKIQRNFTSRDVRELWDNLRASDFDLTVILEKLKEKNISIPSTLEELRATPDPQASN